MSAEKLEGKTETFVIIKKNRKFYAATKNGYKCKIIIDDNSKDLELGQQELMVTDESVRTKYGTDLIFKLSCSASKVKEAGICTLKSDSYNEILVRECRKLGGNWDKENSVWVFSALVEDQVELLDEKYNSEKVAVELKFLELVSFYERDAEIAGITIARATGRDSGAELFNGVAVIKGEIRSGGSRKNWATVVEEDTVVRMYMSKLCINDIDTDVIKIKILEK